VDEEDKENERTLPDSSLPVKYKHKNNYPAQRTERKEGRRKIFTIN